MNLRRAFTLATAALFLQLSFVSSDWSMFQYIEMDAMNETVEISPVQIMFIALMILFTAILSYFEYIPFNLTPLPYPTPFVGRSFHGIGFRDMDTLLLGTPKDPISLGNLKRVWDFGKVLITTDYKSCVYEAICEFEELNGIRARKIWDELENSVENTLTCAQRFNGCPLNFKRLIGRLLEHRSS